MIRQKAVQQYLERHAESEVGFCERTPGTWQRVVVIPVCNEDESFLSGLLALERAADRQPGGTLVIVVVNGAADAASAAHAQNAQLLQRLSEWCWPSHSLAEGARIGRRGALDVLVLDRASESRRLPKKQGVGLARKIGCDLALALWAAGKHRGEWIHVTDADVIVPEDYLAIAAPERNTAAALYPFVHVPLGSELQQQALRFYEIYLRYYVLGLAWAGSPYAYHSIGSTLALVPLAYVAVRGFPRRRAAEDFYLLNKLAKIGSIRSLDGPTLQIQGRPSDRVPFGTGRAVARVAEQLARDEAPRLYDPRVFAVLQRCLGLLEKKLSKQETTPFEREALLASSPGLLEKLSALHCATGSRGGPAHVARQTHAAFDGLRTLKLLHYLRDALYPDLPWRQALEEASFLGDIASLLPALCAEVDAGDLAPIQAHLARMEQLWHLASPPRSTESRSGSSSPLSHQHSST
jgi:hypothetical protein